MLLVALIPLKSYSQSSTNALTEKSSLKLSLSEAQRIAIEENKTLQNASYDVLKAKASRWQAIATMLPQITAKGDYSNMCGYSMTFGQGMTISMPPSGQLTLTTSIALSGVQVIATQIARLSMDMADITKAKTEQQIAEQVKGIYYSILVTEETQKLLEKNLVNLKDVYKITLSSVKAGVQEEIEADKISVQVITMENTIVSTKRSKEMALNSLRLLLDLKVDTPIELIQSIDDLINIKLALSLSAEPFVLESNYDYQLLQKNTILSHKNVSSTAWAYGPSLSVFHQYTKKKYFSDEGGFNMTPPNMIGISISVPIFSSFSRYKALKVAKINYSKQLNTLEQTENSLKIQHSQLVYNLKTSYDSYKAQKKNVKVSEKVFQNVSKKYDYGTASSLEICTANTSLIQAQTTYVSSLLNFINAQIELEKLLNK